MSLEPRAGRARRGPAVRRDEATCAPGLPPTRPAFTCCTRCSRPRSSTERSRATTSGSSPGCWSRTAAARAWSRSSCCTGQVRRSPRKAVILCTGGCGRVFPFTTNASINTGDGMAIAYRAGAPLKDMEFVQYHPTGLPFTGILITEAARAEGGFLLNKDGYRYLQDYDLGEPDARHPVLRSMELGPRDRLSQAFVQGGRRAGRSTARTGLSSTSTCAISARR